jgi:hypothetical protein
MSRFFYYHKSEDIVWFRIFGYGLSFSKKFTFSQRYGFKKYIYFFGYVISYLKSNKH